MVKYQPLVLLPDTRDILNRTLLIVIQWLHLNSIENS